MITICSVVFNDKKTQLFDYMVRSVLKFTEEDVNFIICDNGGNDLDKYRKDSRFQIINKISNAKGSLQHGQSLNKLASIAKPPFAIIEPDVVVLNKDWHKLPSDKKIAAIKKTKNGSWDVYHVCFLFFKESLPIFDFTPGSTKTNVSRSFKAKEDVGWKISQSMRPQDVKTLDFIDCKEKGTIFSGFQSDEFHFNGSLIAAQDRKSVV